MTERRDADVPASAEPLADASARRGAARRRAHRPPPPPVFQMANALLGVALRVARVRLVVDGAERLPDQAGVIIASNHLSITDPPLICLAVDRASGRRVRYMAKAEAMAMPLLGPILHAYGGFAVRRGRPDREAYRMARQVLEAGDWLGLAPEGTRSRTGVLGEPKPGVALLAMRSGATIVPTAIWGSERLWPVGAHVPRLFTTVTIRFGEAYRPEPVEPTALASATGISSAGEREGGSPPAEGAVERASPTPDGGGRSNGQRRQRDALDATSEDLMNRIARLLPPEYRGRFG